MKPFSRWKFVGLLILVFAAGTVTGAVGCHWFTKRAFAAAFDFDRWPDRGVRLLDDRLRLTPEQKPRIRAIQERLARRMKDHFQSSLIGSGRLLLEAGREVHAELTPEQQAIHTEMGREMREAFRRHLHIDLPDDPASE